MRNRVKKVLLNNLIPIIFSIFASFCFVLSLEILPVAKNEVSYIGYPLTILKVENFFLFGLVFICSLGIWHLGYRLLKFLEVKLRKCEINSDLKVKIIACSVILLSWSICWCTFFPGTAMNDTIAIISDPLSRAKTQPLFYALIVNGIMHNVENTTGSLFDGWAVYVFLQMLLFATIIIFSMQILIKKKISKKLVWIYIAYYALLPLNADYAITVVKDSMYAYATFLFIICFVQIIDSNGDWLNNWLNRNIFIISVITMAFTRSNGKIILIMTLIYCALKWRSKLAVYANILLLTVCISFFINAIVLNTSTESCSFRESMSVPLVQIGAVLANDGKISEEQKERVDKYLPSEIWKEKYSFSFTDPIKFSSKFDNKFLNENKKEFLKLWAELGIQNMKIYIKAYLYHTYGFWNLITDVDWASPGGQSVFFTTCNNTRNTSFNEYVTNNGLDNINLWSEEFGKVTDAFYRWGCNFLGIGQVFWIYVMFWSYLIKDKKFKYMFINVILLLNWLCMMAAAPTSKPIRYLYLLILIFPFILLIHTEQGDQSNAC